MMKLRDKIEDYWNDSDVNLKSIADSLDGIVAIILNQNPKTITDKLTKVVAAKVAGIGTIGGIGGLISALGTATTGTAIGSLSGAAATSAKLYWIGSVFGLGATGGFFVLGGLGLVGGAAAVLGIRKLQGSSRSIEELQETEIKIVYSCSKISKAIRLSLETKEKLPEEQVRQSLTLAITPIAQDVEKYLLCRPKPGAEEARISKNLDLMRLWNGGRKLKTCLRKLRNELGKIDIHA